MTSSEPPQPLFDRLIDTAAQEASESGRFWFLLWDQTDSIPGFFLHGGLGPSGLRKAVLFVYIPTCGCHVCQKEGQLFVNMEAFEATYNRISEQNGLWKAVARLFRDGYADQVEIRSLSDIEGETP